MHRTQSGLDGDRRFTGRNLATGSDETESQLVFLAPLVNHFHGSGHSINLPGPHFLSTQVGLYLPQKGAFDMKDGNKLNRNNLSKTPFLFNGH